MKLKLDGYIVVDSLNQDEKYFVYEKTRNLVFSPIKFYLSVGVNL
jgi:hypothetical protein